MRIPLGMLLLAAAAASAGPAAADEAVRGRLCLREPAKIAIVERCNEVEGTQFEVEPASDDRIWIWSRDDMRAIAIGALEGGASEIALPDEPLAASLEITGSPDREWPQPTLLAIGPADRPALAKIELSPMHAERLRELLLPRGSWVVSLRADRHVIWSEGPFRLVDEPFDLGRIELEPFPQIHGTVIDREGELLQSVLLIAEDGTPLSTSVDEGELLWEATCDEDRESCLLPEWFRLEYPDTAPVWFQAIRRDRDRDLDIVRMAPGGTLDLRIDRSALAGPIVVELVDDPKPVPALERYPVLSYVELAEDESSVTLENLPEGMLRLDLRGTRSGEHFSEYLVVRAGETLDHEVVLQPRTVVFDVKDDGKEMSGVTLTVTSPEPPKRISQTMPTDADGRTSLTLWRSGRHDAHIAHLRLRGGVAFDPTQVEEPLPIEIGSSTMIGQVVDDETSEPIGGAMVVALNMFYTDETAPGIVTDELGRYEIEGLMTGSNGACATADHYRRGGKGLDVGPGVNGVETIRLKRLVPYTITAIWEDGSPAARAALVWEGEEPADPEKMTDEHGRITVELVPPLKPSTVHAGPVEQSGKVRVGRVERACRGTICRGRVVPIKSE